MMGERDNFTEPVAPYLYSFILARNCSGKEFCYEVAQDGELFISSKNDSLLIIERLYLNPETKLGPHVSEPITPIIIHYAPKESNYYTALVQE